MVYKGEGIRQLPARLCRVCILSPLAFSSHVSSCVLLLQSAPTSRMASSPTRRGGDSRRTGAVREHGARGKREEMERRVPGLREILALPSDLNGHLSCHVSDTHALPLNPSFFPQRAPQPASGTFGCPTRAPRPRMSQGPRAPAGRSRCSASRARLPPRCRSDAAYGRPGRPHGHTPRARSDEWRSR